MQPNEMRAELKEAGITCPVSNKDVIAKYNEAFPKVDGGSEISTPTNSTPQIVTLASTNIYTYVGVGDEPPHMINFMGLQKFIRGDATEVTDLAVIEKIQNHPCFTKGAINKDILFENDEQAKKKAQAQRDEDVKTQIAIDRINRG